MWLAAISWGNYPERPKLSDGGPMSLKCKPRREPAVRCSAWLGHKVVISQTPSEQNDAAVTVTRPRAAGKSNHEANKPPRITNQHQHSEHSQKNPLRGIWLWLAEQPKATDPDCKPQETTQDINCRPSLYCLPVESANQRVDR